MIRLEIEIPIILCKLERIFPPSFFDSMEHLPVHLSYKARIGGPVQYRWMYPFERFLRRLKNNVRNKARVEGFICNAYLVEEASYFCSYYFADNVTNRQRKCSRNSDDAQSIDSEILSIFKFPGKPIGASVNRWLNPKEYHAARIYLLLNYDEVKPYLNLYEQLQIQFPSISASEIDKKIETEFAIWFEIYVKERRISNVQDERIKNLASGPLYIVMSSSPPVHTGQTVLRIVGGSFVPHGHTVAAYISKKLKERQCASGHTWKHVDPEMKEFYYHEFLKKYTWEPGQEEDFKKTWNNYCKKLYKDMMYKWRKDGKKPTYMLDEVWNAWQRIWAAEKWQQYSVKAQNNRNPNAGGTSTGSSKHTAGSKSIVEHAIDLASTLHRPGTSWEIFRTTHKKKDGTFVDERSKAIDDDMTNRVAQASQPDVEGGDLVRLSDEAINDIYFDVVGGSKKNALYGLGSHAQVAYDHVMAPRARGRSSSQSIEVQELRLENQALRDRVTTLEQSERMIDERVRAQVDRQFRGFMDRWTIPSPSTYPVERRFDSQETEDPNAPDK
ncbi:uncharacterized protein LOC141837120 [Curcuma longa]|uniref:uncharacterized protein LOC141837120 n=1 Tax=Curcuma longa TaxID=136217 RepID=UPI003D9DCCBE